MTSTNPVISRLQNQHSRTQGMLSPGKKQRQPGGLLHAPLTSVAADFAGRKFQLAAQKMRTLDAGKLRQTLSSGLTSLSTEIQSKFADIQKIIHINPGASREDTIWSSVETPFPDSQPFPARQETSDEPGVMRSGSIIQKMNMIPKPGQSLSSFKNQVQKQPRITKTLIEKKPVIGQNVRRFSQVQEVITGQKQTLPEIPAIPVNTDETQTPAIQAKETPGTATIQSQPDTSVSGTEKPVITSRVEAPLSKPFESPKSPVIHNLPPEMPLREKPRSSEPVIRAEQHNPVEIQSTESKNVQPAKRSHEEAILPKSQTEQPPQAQLPVQEKEILRALPVVKKPPVQEELKKALPVKKEQEQPKIPVARAVIKSRKDAPVSSIRPIIQRQPEADVSPSAPVRAVIQQPMDTELPIATPVRPVTQQPTDADLPPVAHFLSTQQQSQTTDPSVKFPAPPAPAETDAGRPEMPLRQNIGYRQHASRAVRAINPDQMIPVSPPSLIHREETPLLTRFKHFPATTQGSRPEFSTKNDPLPLQKQDHPGSASMASAALPMNLPSRQVSQIPTRQNFSPIPMPLTPPTPVVAAPKVKPAISPVQPQVSQAPRTSSAVPKTNNTIQRAWEGHTGPSQNTSEESEGSNNRAESTDLQALAENVFPYVKRILEIESERSSGKLR